MSALPTPQLERWKYSNLPAYVSDTYTSEPLAVGYDGDATFVSPVDGETSLWAADVYQDMDLWSDMQDILSVVIPEDTHVENPVNISTSIEEGKKSEGAIHIHVKKGASLTIMDDTSVDGWSHRVTNISLDDGAELTHIRTGSGSGVITNLTQIQQGAGSKYNAYAMNTYGEFMRDQIHVRLQGEKAECHLSGVKILKGKQHCDTCILIEHEAPNCNSNQNYRNILDDNSRGVFQGKVHVHQIAQLTDGYQFCNTIMLSDKAEMDTKPELEIYADDVKCSHGAVTAQPEAEPLFYLMARGIPKKEAEAMLLQAFTCESLEALEDHEDIYERLSAEIEKILKSSVIAAD